MKGHGEKLSRKQEQAIAALLGEKTFADAAKKTGVSEVTLWRWTQEETFSREYRQARRAVVERAVSALQSATDEAVDTLKRNLHCENPGVEVRAACAILEQAMKGIELIDLAGRLEILEGTLENQSKEKDSAK